MAFQSKRDSRVRVATRVEDPLATRQLFDALKQRARGTTTLVKVTKADAVAMTGMPAAQAEPALTDLVKHYRSHVGVTDDGELIYQFDPTLERRDAVPWRERLGTLAASAWIGFQWIFKVWIAVTLVAYVVAFVAMMISMSLARRGDSNRRDGDGFGLPFIWYLMMPDLAPRQRYGYGYGQPRRMAPSAGDGPKKRFYQVVFDFVFGPKPTLRDPRAADKRLIAFVQAQKGRVTASEMAALSGVSLARADEELTRLMAEYDGEVEVADDGTLIYAFDDLRRQSLLSTSATQLDFERPEPDPALTGNTAGGNAAVGGFAGFNVLAALTIGPAFVLKHGLGDTGMFWLSLFPLLFSAVFLAIPTTRWLVERGRRSKRRRRRARKMLLKAAFQSDAAGLDPRPLIAQVAKAQGIDSAQVDMLLTGVVADLDGDVITDDAGQMRYTFPRLAEERAQVALARAKAPQIVLGAEIFSSAAEGDGDLTADRPSTSGEDLERRLAAILAGPGPRGRA